MFVLRHEPQPSEPQEVGGGGGKHPRKGVVGEAALPSGISCPNCGRQRVEGGRIDLGRKGAHSPNTVLDFLRSLKLKAVFVWRPRGLDLSEETCRAGAQIFPHNLRT